MDDLIKALDAIELHKWHIVLLAARAKRPVGLKWQVTTEPSIAKSHLGYGGNIGLVCGPDSGVAVLDFDNNQAMVEMFESIAPLHIWVMTGSDKAHCYIRWEENLPAKITWKGAVIGEIQRGPVLGKSGAVLQHVVMPPSIHPNGRPYVWAGDPIQPVPDLLDEWRKYFSEEQVPDFITREALGHPKEETWDGPPLAEVLFRASQQPGAKRRRNGIKFRCPGCAKEGRDKSKDNALVQHDGRWGCAVDQSHRRDIAEVLGCTMTTSVRREVAGDDELRDVSLEDL